MSRRQKFVAFWAYPLLGLGVAMCQAAQGSGLEVVGWFAMVVAGALGTATAISHLRYITGYQADGFGLVIDPPRREPKTNNFGQKVGAALGEEIGATISAPTSKPYNPMD